MSPARASSAAACATGSYIAGVHERSPMRDGTTMNSSPPGANSAARRRRNVSASASAWRLKAARVSAPPARARARPRLRPAPRLPLAAAGLPQARSAAAQPRACRARPRPGRGRTVEVADAVFCRAGGRRREPEHGADADAQVHRAHRRHLATHSSAPAAAGCKPCVRARGCAPHHCAVKGLWRERDDVVVGRGGRAVAQDEVLYAARPVVGRQVVQDDLHRLRAALLRGARARRGARCVRHSSGCSAGGRAPTPGRRP